MEFRRMLFRQSESAHASIPSKHGKSKECGSEEPASMSSLSDDCASIVFSYLYPIDVLSIGQSCKHFEQLITDNKTSIKFFWQFHTKLFYRYTRDCAGKSQRLAFGICKQYTPENYKLFYIELRKYDAFTLSTNRTVVTNCMLYDLILIFKMLLKYPQACRECEFSQLKQDINHEFLLRNATALEMACEHNAIKIANYLLSFPEIDILMNDEDSDDNDGYSDGYGDGYPMLMSKRNGIFDRRKNTISESNTVNAITICIKYDNSQMLKTLIYHQSMTVEKIESIYPLHYAIKHNAVKCIKLLIGFGININSFYHGLTPLQVACNENRTKIVSILVNDFGDYVDVNAKARKSSKKGQTALMMACSNTSQNVRMIKYLVKWKVIDCGDKDNFTRPRSNTVNKMINNNGCSQHSEGEEYGQIKRCNIFATDKEGWNCFMHAARNGNDKAVEYLYNYVNSKYDSKAVVHFICQKSIDLKNNANWLAIKSGSRKTMEIIQGYYKLYDVLMK